MYAMELECLLRLTLQHSAHGTDQWNWRSWFNYLGWCIVINLYKREADRSYKWERFTVAYAIGMWARSWAWVDGLRGRFIDTALSTPQPRALRDYIGKETEQGGLSLPWSPCILIAKNGVREWWITWMTSGETNVWTTGVTVVLSSTKSSWLLVTVGVPEAMILGW